MRSDDLARLRIEYADRERRLAGSDIYSLFSPSTLFMWQSRQRAILSILRRHGMYPLTERKVLEVGSGNGGVLLELLQYGGRLIDLYGIDLLGDRIVEARTRLPHLVLACADAQHMPYPDHAFDLVMQFTAFSSILNGPIRANIASEMRRVVKPGGLILWYDFWLNPLNVQTRGIRPREIRQLFPGCDYEFDLITLAPPLARRLVPISWQLSTFVEKLAVFNTHYLVAIRPC